MSWNQPTAENKQRTDQSKNHGLLAGLIIIALGAAVLYFIFSGDPSRGRKADAAEGRPHKVGDRPHKVGDRPQVKSETVKISHREFVATNNNEQTKIDKPVITMSDVFYSCRYSDGRLVNPRPIFKDSCDNFIAGVITEEPGVRFLDLQLDENFDEEFEESLKTPITINADDDENTKRIKEAVIESKQKIQEYMREGLTPSQVVMDARDEMNKIADYYDMLDENYQKLIGEEQDIDIVKLYVKESNKILDEYGARHLQVPESDEELLEDMNDARQTHEDDMNKEETK